MKKVLIALMYILGFPALIALVIWDNFEIIKGGISYGIFPFVGIIVAALFGLIYLIVVLVQAKKGKNKKRKKKITVYHQTFVAMILCFCMLGGFWMLIDVALPDFLADATSSTIYYEDLADNYQERAKVNKGLLDEYITLNYENGNLRSKTLDEYIKEGAKNSEVSELLKIHFASIDKNGYTTFGAPYINMATSDRMTIAVLVHLLLDDRSYEALPYQLYNSKTKETVTAPVKWNVLDMNGKMALMEVDLFSEDGYKEFINGLGGAGAAIKLLMPNAEKFKEFILDTVNGKGNPSPDLGEEAGVVPTLTYDLTGSPIYLSIDGKTLVLQPSVSSRGSLDYMRMAWLNNNGLLYAIVALFSLRKIFLIFAAWMVVNNFIIGLLRGMGKELKDKKLKAQSAAEKEKIDAGYPYGYGYTGGYGYDNNVYGGYGNNNYSNNNYNGYNYYQPQQQQPYNNTYLPTSTYGVNNYYDGKQ